MKKLLVALAVLQAGALLSQAAITVSFSQNPTSGPIFISSLATGGVPLPTGSLVRIGTFAAEPNAAGNLDTDFGSFQEFATTTIGRDAGGVTDGILLRGGAAGISGPDSFAGQPIYIWVYNAPTAAGATDEAIYRSMTGAAPTVFPAPNQPTSTTISVTTFTSAYGMLLTPATSTPDPDGGGALRQQLQLAGVPEPSTSLVMLFAGAGLLLRRRRA
jgi:hypothetical protein